jgi:hypothetical protein
MSIRIIYCPLLIYVTVYVLGKYNSLETYCQTGMMQELHGKEHKLRQGDIWIGVRGVM